MMMIIPVNPPVPPNPDMWNRRSGLACCGTITAAPYNRPGCRDGPDHNGGFQHEQANDGGRGRGGTVDDHVGTSAIGEQQRGGDRAAQAAVEAAGAEAGPAPEADDGEYAGCGDGECQGRDRE